MSAARGGAFVYSFTVKDAVAAARAAGAKVRLLEARRSYARGARKRLEPVGPVWIAGHTGSLSLLRPERGVNVLPLVSEKTCTRSTRATGLTRLWSSSGTGTSIPCQKAMSPCVALNDDALRAGWWLNPAAARRSRLALEPQEVYCLGGSRSSTMHARVESTLANPSGRWRAPARPRSPWLTRRSAR